MTPRKVIFTTVLLTLLQLPMVLTGQNQCLENLITANKLLESGKINECIALVKPCSAPENEISIRSNAYRLMAISWLQLNNRDSALKSATSMLTLNPTYKPSVLKDPAEFIKLLSSIQVIPKFSIGLAFSAGTNFAIPAVENSYIVSDYRKTYTSANGLQFGTWIGFYITPKVQIELGLISTTKKFSIDFSPYNWEVNVKENNTYLDIPLNINYYTKITTRFNLITTAGLYGGYMLYGYNDFKSTYLPNNTSFELYQLNIINRRNRWNHGITGGLGFQYKLKHGMVSVKADYYYSNVNIVKTADRWKYTDQIYTYYYVDDDIKLQNLCFRIGYTYFMNYRVYQKRKDRNAKL